MDSPRERDQTVERLLRQSLGTPPRGGVTDACLDGETLAAWAAGGLAGSALDAVQLHVADCARCQSLAGTLARINATAPQAEPAGPSRRWLAWFVPLTAAAAAVALWFAVPGNPGRPVSSTELARVEQTPTPTPRAEPGKPAKIDARKEDAQEKAVQTPSAPAAPPAADRGQASAAPQATELRDERARTDAVQQPARQQPALAGAAAKEEAPAAAATAAAGVAAPLAERASVARSALSAANAVAPDIISPDPAIRWRILGSAVQHSSNGGSTWDAAPVGVAAELTAGAAPAATVCWLVGRNGVVLLTTDGRTWRRVPFPEMTDLSAVRTVDAGGRVASVSTTDGRTFVTTDAGATWSPR